MREFWSWIKISLICNRNTEIRFHFRIDISDLNNLSNRKFDFFRVQVFHISWQNFSWQSFLLVKIFTPNANGVDSGQGRSSFRNFRPCISETNHRFRYKICCFVVSLQCYNYLIRSFDCNFTRSMSSHKIFTKSAVNHEITTFNRHTYAKWLHGSKLASCG